MRPIAMFAGIVSAVALTTGTVVAVPAAAEPTTPTAPTAAPRTVTVRLINPDNGSVLRTWTGAPELVGAVRARLVPPSDRSGTVDPASTVDPDAVETLIRRVTCSDPNPYWVVRNYPPLVCFADAGDVNVAIYSVYEVDSGNNIGWFTWCYNSRCYKQPMGRWNYMFFANRVFVSHIHIN